MSITISGTQITLANNFIRRELDISEGPATTLYHIRPTGVGAGIWLPTFVFEPCHPFESAVTVDGKTFQAGPWKAANVCNWAREGVFCVQKVLKEKTGVGEALILDCKPRSGYEIPVELFLRYELADDLPLLVKSVKVKNISTKPVIINNLTVETIRFIRRGSELHVFTDYYWNTDIEDNHYYTWIRTEFPDPINLRLEPGESFESFRCFQAVVSPDADSSAIVMHRVLKKIAPWITRTLISQQFFGLSSYQELADLAVQAERDGVEIVHTFLGIGPKTRLEQLFTNTGDYIPRPDLFPNGEDDLKRLVEHYHKHNLLMVPYCSLTLAETETQVVKDHPEWQYLGPEGIRYEPTWFGNMCYQSGWGEYISEKLKWLVDKIGFDGLQIDGPYHGLPCLATNHKHRTAESVRFMNWQWERDFFGWMRKHNLIIATPQNTPACYLLGVTDAPGGYTEEDYEVMGGMPLVVAFRSRLYDARYKNPACSTWSFLSIDKYHGHSIEVSEENTASYNHALGGTFGYGHSGLLHGAHLYVGPKTREVFLRWVKFFKEHRHTLSGEIIHLVRPNGLTPDAVMHVSLNANPPAVLVVFNPCNKTSQIFLALPLHYAGFIGNSVAEINEHGKINLDVRGVGLVTIDLKPLEVKTLAIRHG